MRDSLKDTDSCKESIERGGESCSVVTTHTTLHSIKEIRVPIQIRMRKSIHDAVGSYCGKNMPYGQFYEQAAILFMDINPKDYNLLNVLPPEINNNTVKDRMLSIICKNDLQDIIPVLKSLHENGRDTPKNLLEKLSKVFDKCYKINNPSGELNSLIMEAIKYVE